MSKALLISEIFPPRHGGSGRWFVELYSRLPKEDSVIAAGSVEGDDDADADLADRLKIERLGLSSANWGLRSLEGLRFYVRTHRQLATLAKAHGVSAIHCGRCLPEGVMGWLLSKRLGIPFLCYVHGEDIQTAQSSRELSWIIRRVFKAAVVIIANSHNSAELLSRDWGVQKEKIAVLHPGMDADRFVPAPRDEQIREFLSWDGRKTILTVGRLQRRKGHDMMIQALPRIRERVPDVLYSIIGDGEERQRLQALARDLEVTDQVQFLGEVTDAQMIQCYQQCALFALPNRTDGADIEGFGMVLAEAQACGKAVLAGDSGGTRETMLIEETGVIADCKSPDTLAAAVIDLLTARDLEAMGARGREHVATTLDWRVHVQKAAAIFADLR